jgi:putative transposase
MTRHSGNPHCGMIHVRTYHTILKSNGKMEQWFKTLKGECIRVKTPLCLEDGRRVVTDFVAHYNRASYCHTFLCV